MENSKRCFKCDGKGLIETDFILCKNCNGQKCFKCHGTGILQYAWSECPRCLGNGIECIETKNYDKVKIIKEKNNLKIKKNKSI